MFGATEFAQLFGVEQHGKLFLVPGKHARGETFHIYVLPSEDRIEGMPWNVEGAVEVYGIISGQPGWTESYGWLHRGKWEQDFSALVDQRKEAVRARIKKQAQADSEEREAAKQKTEQLLANY